MTGQYIGVEQATRIGRHRHAVAPPPLLGLGGRDFEARYNRTPFFVDHRLQTHLLFKREALFDLCRRHPVNLVQIRSGKVPVDEDFGGSIERYRGGLALRDVLDNFEALGAYVIVNNPERDPIYRPLMDDLLAEVAAATADVDPHITWYSTYVFISSFEAVTPYHMDREMNFLFQIAGRKQVRLWDRDDADVMTPAQKDELLAYASGLRPPYRAVNEPKGRSFDLVPGLGLHHPFIAPHVVTTASDFSVSLAFTYRTRRTDRWTDAHRLNHALRARGLAPGPIGTSAGADATKALVARLARRARSGARAIRTVLAP